ncbi:hypothetical protein ACOACO_17540 [Nocardioides sp. CPCC 205120]|uniref:hypothetical protein n=1 Tax=Nocardioides sp. CPCC 205120 TaxID=3406462 RepID=UPI003B5018ED
MLILLLVAGLGLSAVAFRSSLSSLAIARMRFKMWATHDDIIDALVEGRYARPDLAEGLLKRVRVGIDGAPECTFYRVVSLYYFARADWDELQEGLEPTFYDIDASDDPVLAQHVHDYQSAVVYGTFRTSLLGRIALVALPPAVWLVGRLKGRQTDLREPEDIAVGLVTVDVEAEFYNYLARYPRVGRGNLASAAC